MKQLKDIITEKLYLNKHINLYNESNENKVYVNMILLDHEQESVLIMRRANNYIHKFHGQYGFPGGSLSEKDKDRKSGAIRELKEETGIELTFNEERWCKKFDTIVNNDGSISEYYITHCELEKLPEIKLSKEHSAYEWYNSKSKNNHNWMPDIFQIIQKIL